MVLYKLGIQGKLFDLSKIINIDAKTSLQTIDKFTSSFSNEDILKQYLINNNIMKREDLDKKIFIYYKNNCKLKSLPVIYSDELEYFDGLLINAKFKEYSCNKNFLIKIKEKYTFRNSNNMNPQIDNIRKLEVFLDNANKYGIESLEINQQTIVEILGEIYNIETRTFDRKNNGYKFDYRGYRDIIHFVYNFDIMEKLKNMKDKLQDEYEYLDEDEKIARKNRKWILSSNGDPDFPPNSDEERKYLRDECEDDVNQEKYKL